MIDSTVKEEKHITYDAIKIGLASPEKIRECIISIQKRSWITNSARQIRFCSM